MSKNQLQEWVVVSNWPYASPHKTVYCQRLGVASVTVGAFSVSKYPQVANFEVAQIFYYDQDSDRIILSLSEYVDKRNGEGDISYWLRCLDSVDE